jgi:hypothetical protein
LILGIGVEVGVFRQAKIINSRNRMSIRALFDKQKLVCKSLKRTLDIHCQNHSKYLQVAQELARF